MIDLLTRLVTGDAGAVRRRTTWVIGALIAARVAALAYLMFSNQDTIEGGLAGDVHRYVEMSTAHGIPYRDFQVEYPPVTYGLIRLLNGSTLGFTIGAVAVSQFACDIGIAFVLRWVWGVRAQIAYLALGLPLIVYPFIYARIDLFTALLTVVGLALVRKARDVSGGATLAVAVLAKLWPLTIAPILLIERRRKGMISLIITGLVGGIVWLAVAGPLGIQQVLSFRDATGWQVESIPGILWHLRDTSRIKFESGAFRTGLMPLWARPALTLVGLLFIALAWWLAARRRREGADDHVVYALAPLACVLASLIFAPILSPQYIVWMLPFAALVAAQGDVLMARLTLAVTVITTISYVLVPSAAGGALYATLPVLVRNGLLVAMLVVSFQSLARLRSDGTDPVEVEVGAEGYVSDSAVSGSGAAPTSGTEPSEPVIAGL
jgi:hypothetical protein